MAFVTNFTKKVETDTSNLFLIHAEDNGLECWHYIIGDRVKVHILKEKLKYMPCTLNLEEYGKVIRSGWGKGPSPEVKKRIESGDYTPASQEAEYKILWLNNEQEGKVFHAFIAVRWELAEKFEYMANNVGNMNLDDWGIVLETGWGPAPKERIEFYSQLETQPA